MSNVAIQFRSRRKRTFQRGSQVRADRASDHDARRVYFDLLRRSPHTSHVEQSRLFLLRQLDLSAHCPVDIPEEPGDLRQWSRANAERVGAQYTEYLNERRAGGSRRYFSSKAHALYFLKGVAPTKLVDGSWLYGLFEHWKDPRFLPLLQTYLEELGEGDPRKNHVVLYKRLLATHGCQQWTRLSDTYFVQGAIQLSLARHTRHFLPEVIGFNLGYEQLPLHLLITAYELNELGIDPYYFTLHVTVDNADSGHAQMALQGVLDTLPQVGDPQAFYQRVRNGYALNSLGASTNSVIAEFDLEAELVSLLSSKAVAGACLHSDYARIGGKTINQWLSEPDSMPEFLMQLQGIGWIRRHEDPQNSTFWRLIDGDAAAMHGVFTPYEQQVIYDWIAGDWRPAKRAPTFRCIQAMLRRQAPSLSSLSEALAHEYPVSDFGMEPYLFRQKLASFAEPDDAMDWLIGLISPVHHHTQAGLAATRTVCHLLKAGH